jgi:hypothetical protein
MSQIFHRAANTIFRIVVLGGVGLAGASLYLILAINRSSYVTKVDVDQEQPIPFSHKHHVQGVGIDCRYCHTTVETSAFAGIPPTKTCMTCHSQVWSDSPTLEPVRASYRDNKPIQWVRVNNVPDYVYFNHSIHVNKGIGCATCHGPVDQMPLMRKAQSLQMEWCLECHRNPERYVRPRDQVFNLHWQAEDQATLGPKLVREYKINRLTDCSVCHR